MNSFLFPHVLLFILDDTLSTFFFFLLLSLLAPLSLHILLHDSALTCKRVLDSEMQHPKVCHSRNLGIASCEFPILPPPKKQTEYEARL